MEVVQKCIWIAVSAAIGPTPIKCLLWSAKCFQIPLGITGSNCLCEGTNKRQKGACLFHNWNDSELLGDKESDKNYTVLNLLWDPQIPEYCSWCLQYGNQENAGGNGSICVCHLPGVAWKIPQDCEKQLGNSATIDCNFIFSLGWNGDTRKKEIRFPWQEFIWDKVSWSCLMWRGVKCWLS